MSVRAQLGSGRRVLFRLGREREARLTSLVSPPTSSNICKKPSAPAWDVTDAALGNGPGVVSGSARALGTECRPVGGVCALHCDGFALWPVTAGASISQLMRTGPAC
eukprot:CAMPEP_0179196258 /NCGR_PEP_ID=MMETSP0796-20121207/97580_1 /TAXON_ID=73915 /ORGANISM="Pyrodinium bahamense, Strain pbaha01" /LENGTH=106 /DNA_ID=CAMNT_0020900649 /DNA_START=112 /DNA_END=429 /DNA_ORIENTATION=-